MRRAFAYFLAQCRHQSTKPISPVPPRSIVSNVPSTSSPYSSSSILKPCPKSPHGLLLLKLLKFLAPASRNLDTLVEKPAAVPWRQWKIQERSQLEEAFESVGTRDEMIGAFKKMESSFNEKERGLASLKIGLKLDQEGDPSTILHFADRVMKGLNKDGKLSLLVAMALQLMGSANYMLKRFSDSLGYLNRSNRMLAKLEEEGSGVEDIRPVQHTVLLELANMKTAMGRREEAIRDLKKCLGFF